MIRPNTISIIEATNLLCDNPSLDRNQLQTILLSESAQDRTVIEDDVPPINGNPGLEIKKNTKGDILSIPRQPIEKSWLARVGGLGLVIVGLGTFAILASCAILLFLWIGADIAPEDRAPGFWETIVFRGWTTRVVTICSAALRTAMSFQTGLVAAVIAAVMLESGIKFHDAAIVSIQTALNPNPMGLLPASFRTVTTAGYLGFLQSFLIILAVLSAVLSTFVSTILLSDFQTKTILASPSTESRLVEHNGSISALLGLGSYWRSRPQANWRFAEARGNPLSVDGVVDSGDVYRALLPINDSALRASLEFYEGPTTVTNFRTLCVGPTFHDLAGRIDESSNYIDLQSNLSAEIAGMVNLSHMNGTSCYLSISAEGVDRPLSLCLVGNETVPSTEADPISTFPYSFARVMVINSSMHVSSYNFSSLPPFQRIKEKPREFPTSSSVPNSFNFKTNKEGPWTKVLSDDGKELFSASLCFISVGRSLIYNITMSGKHILHEPPTDWRFANYQQDVLSQLGVGIEPQNSKERGILDLRIGGGPIQKPLPKVVAQQDCLLLGALLEASEFVGYNMANTDIYHDTQFDPHQAHVSVFRGIMKETQNPGLALQALMFRFYQMAYYDTYPSFFNGSYLVTTRFSKDMLIPAKWTGLIIVLSLVGAHFVLLFASFILYATKTKFAFLGNSWEAVSRLVSPETEGLIQAADMITDNDIKKWSEGMHECVYRVSHSVSRDRVELQMEPKR